MNTKLGDELITKKKELDRIKREMISKKHLYEKLCKKNKLNKKKLLLSLIFLCNFAYFSTLFLSDASISLILFSILPVEFLITGASMLLIKFGENSRNKKIYNAFLEYTEQAKAKELVEKRIKEIEKELNPDVNDNMNYSQNNEKIERLNMLKEELINFSSNKEKKSSL